MRLLLIALRLPRSIRFPVAWAHHRSPHICVAQAGHPGTPIIAARLTQGNKRATSRRDAFVDSLLVQEALDPTRFRSLALSNRGAGDSERTAAEADYTVESFARDLFAATQALGLRDI